MSDDEFASLKSSLEMTARFGVTNVTFLPSWNAVFVIYAAEWWRREYDGSLWSWKKVFASFKADEKELKDGQRSLIVELGLNYWQRTVRTIDGRSKYLGTIATEGGLPLNQLNQSSGWLGRVFNQVIPKYARFQQSGTDAAQLVSECDYIPKTYQNDQIHAILGDMVTTVVELRQKHQLQECSDPVSYLDQQHRAWRELFPVPIADDVGAKLLVDMIVTAAKADDRSTFPIGAMRKLKYDGSVEFQIEFARFIALETLGLTEDIPGRFDVELVDGNGKFIQLGIALSTDYKFNDKAAPSLKMPKPPSAITGEAALQGYSIRFKHLSETLKEISLIGGETLEYDVPWVFVQCDETWVLEGLASFSTRAKSVRILYPSNWTYQGSEIRSLATVLPNKSLLEASGIIRLIGNEGDAFTIKTAQESASSYYKLKGQGFSFASIPREMYLGLPTLRHVDHESGIGKTIPNSQLTARGVNSKGPWQPSTQFLQGVHEIRLYEQNAILFRKKCVLLPEQFSVRFKPSETSLDGIIFLDYIGNAEVSCDTSIKHNITQDTTGYRIDLHAEQKPPSTVRLILRWSGMAEMATLVLPFPTRGGQVIDGEGNRLSSSKLLFQDQLHGIRLRLFNEQPDRQRHLQLEFKLVDDGSDDLRDVYFRHELKRTGAVIELALIDYLDWIKMLLTISNHLDDYVQLAIYENASELLRVKIGRYPFSLERNLMLGTVELKEYDHARLSFDALNGIELMAMRLSQPEQEHVKLEPQTSEQTATGRWLFDPEKKEAEPWLIYPTQTSTVPLRPYSMGGGL